MSQFSELLKSYMKNSRISAKKAAAAAGIDRTMLLRYLSGERIPGQYSEADKIMEVLTLSPYQQSLLKEAYYREVYGNKNYENFFLIKRVLEKDYSIEVPLFTETQLPENQALQEFEISAVISGKMQLQTELIWLLEKLSQETLEIHIRMVIQPDEKELLRVLLQTCSKFNVNIEHIICLDSDSKDNVNFAAIQSLLAFEMNRIRYQARYYYDNPEAHINQMSMLPYLILVGNYAFLGNKCTDEWLVLKEKEEISFLQRRYEKFREATKGLELSVDSTAEMLDNSIILLDAEESTEIGYFPCITIAFDRYLLNKYLLAEEKEKNTIISTIETLSNQIRETVHWCNYFSEQGLRGFMETGEIPIYPRRIYKRIELVDRLLILERMILLAKAGRYKPYLGNDRLFRIIYCISIEYNARGMMCVRWSREDKFAKVIRIKEQGISESVVGFERFALENGWFYDTQETIARMEQIRDEFVRMMG